MKISRELKRQKQEEKLFNESAPDRVMINLMMWERAHFKKKLFIHSTDTEIN